MRVFLSYRRRDEGGHAGRLHDALVQRLGAKSVFQDVTAIGPGKDFLQEIDRALDGCDATLAIIGPSWLESTPESGVPRLFEPDDFVHMELARALSREIRVVPVLVGGASLPAAESLPDDLRPLLQHQTVVLHDETWHEDVDGLVRRLRGKSTMPRSRMPRFAGAAAALALLLLGGGAWWLFARDDNSSDGGNDDVGEIVRPCGSTGGEAWAPLTLASDATGGYPVEDGSLRFEVRGAESRPLQSGRWEVLLDTRMENDTRDDQYHGDWYYDSLVVGQRPVAKTCFSAEPELIGKGLVSAGKVGFEVVCEPIGYIELVLSDPGERVDVTSDTLEPVDC